MFGLLVALGCGDSEADDEPRDAAGMPDGGGSDATGACIPPGDIGIDEAVLPEPSVTLPAAGGSFIDPTFGTEIIRVTDENDGPFAQHAYSYWPVFNADNTRFHIDVAGEARLYDFDPVAGTVSLVGPLFLGTPCRWEDSSWSHSDPDLLFCHSLNRRLYAYDVTTLGADGLTLIKDFDPDLDGGTEVKLQQMLVSKDDDLFTFHTRDASHKAIAYRHSDGRVWVREHPGMFVDETHVDGSGRWIVILVDGRWDVWDLSTDTVVTVHQDEVERGGLCHQAAGSNLYVGGDCWETGFLRRTLDRPLEPEHIVSFETASGEPEWDFDVHISINHADERWFVSSLYTPAGADPGDWSPWEQEIVAVAVDGSWVRRLAHHHSVFPPDGYYASPRVSTSYDGRWAAFTSNFDNGRRDVYLMRLPTMCE